MNGLSQFSNEDDNTFFDYYDEIMLAHKYRLSLNSVPTQSSFRVLALLFYKTTNSNITSASALQQYVVGTNDEPCYIGGSICAERAAMVQLRFIPDLDHITKIVIVTDAPFEIAPGSLCREYLASSTKVPWNTPVVLSGTKCRFCDHRITLEDTLERKNKLEKNDTSLSCRHDYLHKVTTIRQVYPYASPYTRFNIKETLAFGRRYASGKRSLIEAQLNESQGMLLKHAIRVAKLDSRVDLHPVSNCGFFLS